MDTNYPKRKLFPRSVPLWVLLLLVVVLCATFVALLYIVSNQVYNYTVRIPGQTNGTFTTLSYGAHPELANAAFFQQVKNEFIAQKASFIEADLSAMQLRVYQNGSVLYDVPIATKGKEGSWWETPAGLYKAQGKEENHFSSFGNVYMPSSIPFQGNFFIHGWPYYPDGTPVEGTFSGGCIRLSVEDAAQVYQAVTVGMPILVHEEDFASDSFIYKGKLPQLSASNVLVADVKSNFVLLQKDSQQAVPIASITKLITSIVATEYINIEKEITVPQQALVQTTTPRLRAGQQLSVYSLLYPLLEESSNEAAETLTYFLGPARFIQLMNEKAQALGMEHTQFADASGLSAQNISTAEDLFNLAKYMYNNRSFLLGVSAGRVERPDLYGYPAFQNLENFNVFAQDPAFVGGKIGKTNAAKETYVGIFQLHVHNENRPIAIILLGSENVTADTQQALTHIKNTYADAPATPATPPPTLPQSI